MAWFRTLTQKSTRAIRTINSRRCVTGRRLTGSGSSISENVSSPAAPITFPRYEHHSFALSSSPRFFSSPVKACSPLLKELVSSSSPLSPSSRSLDTPPARSFHESSPTSVTPSSPVKSSSGAPPPRAVPLSRLMDSFLHGTSSVYLEELQRAWESNPRSVDESWDLFFQHYTGKAAAAGAVASGISGQTIQESMRLLLLVRAYQVVGHYKATLDPLNLDVREPPVELDPALYGFTEEDMQREFFIGVWRMKGFLSENRPVQTLRNILERLEQAYCGTIGYEYMHISSRDQCNWLREKIETPVSRKYGRNRREVILDRLIWSSSFESFIAQKWGAAKRFGLEGCETLIPGMKELIDRAAEEGVESIVIGMPHRGRLNVLGNVVRKPLRQIFSEFGGGMKPATVGDQAAYTGSGDVKYHLGTSYDRPTRGGKRIHLSLVANPSHLEAVDPVVIGKTRAKQYYSLDNDRSRHMAVLLHGDGSFSGQGVVYETLHLQDLPNYSTGGTIHLVVNNQVAFTTDPKSSRSSPYCTDVAKALDCPIFHVNGDDVEAVVHCMELAVEWRQKFHSDVVIDLVCYRRFGHNEIDEPSFTQPRMYEVIKSHPPALSLYKKKVVETGEMSTEEVKALEERVFRILNEEFESSKDYVPSTRDWLAAYWAGLKSPEQLSRIRKTGVHPDILREVGLSICTLPSHTHPHRVLKRVYETRKKSIEDEEGIDWATAEALAFSTLLLEGNHVRLSGQDVERGTFSHRHAVIHDQKEHGKTYVPLKHVLRSQPEDFFTISNSSLSEFGVLGFELGYSMENPNSLVLWEAQFGDFANGAQVIFDQFLSGGESKWLRQSGLVCLLPHGYDGQGPEHSSARLERFLQMSDDNPYRIPEMDPQLRKQIQQCNWQVVNVTTPANYFHVLRRQVHRGFRKPLIVMSPKNLLRHPACKSSLCEFDDVAGEEEAAEGGEEAGENGGMKQARDKQGTRFKRLIKDPLLGQGMDEKAVRRVVFCSGKVFYELEEARVKEKANDVALIRVEQLCPFPYDLVMRELRRFPNAEIVWTQEEPMNMGGFSYVSPRLATAMRATGRGSHDDIKYVGRAPSASTATGFQEQHGKEQREVLFKSFQQNPL